MKARTEHRQRQYAAAALRKKAAREGCTNTMIAANLRPGYVAILAVRKLPEDDPAWPQFVEDVLGLPESMVLAVQEAVKAGKWVLANDPIASLRGSAERVFRRKQSRGKTSGAASE